MRMLFQSVLFLLAMAAGVASSCFITATPLQRTATSPSVARTATPSGYLNTLKTSLEKQTQFAQLQPDGEALWTRVRQTITASLNNEWRRGVLKGNRAPLAYWVRCDRTTMAQSDIDQGRLIAVVGVAVQHPGNFSEMRITQQTAGHK